MYSLKKLARLSANEDKKIESIDSIETYVYGTSKYLVSEKEEIKCNNIIRQYKMFHFDYIAKEIVKEHNLEWLQIPDHPNRISINGGS